MIWREKRVLLIVLGVLLAANTIFFFTYRVQYQSRLDELDARLEESDAAFRQAQAARVAAERQYQSYKKTQVDVAEVFNEHWSTQGERLTIMLAEVKRLAEASNLVPRTIAFDRKEVQKAATIGRNAAPRKPIGATEVGVGFAVEGTYEQARRLINLLELSRQFVIIDQISLQARDGQALTLSLHMKTLFRDNTSAPAPVAGNRL